MIVYKAVPSPKSWSFGFGVLCANWREANSERSRIARNALTDKDNATPIVYSDGGDFIVEGWQKGFAA